MTDPLPVSAQAVPGPETEESRQMTNAVDTVQKQLDAYNAHDVDAFLKAYAPDATVLSHDGQTLMTGHEAMRSQYAGLFAEHPDVHAEVPNRLHSGDWVVDEEHVRLDGQQMQALLAYHVSDGLITEVVMLSSP